MTSYEFEKAAKNAVVEIMHEQLGIELAMTDLQLVWFCHLLGAKKCTVYAPQMGTHYAEATYNAAKDEMYVDVYKKAYNVCVPGKELNFSAT